MFIIHDLARPLGVYGIIESVTHRGIAQLVEHWSPKPGVVGSSPAAPATILSIQKISSEVFFVWYNKSMSEDQFTKLFKYMQEFRKEVDDRFNAHDKRFDEVINLIDGYGGKIDSYAQEMVAMDHKINRLEKYI